jgi:hypothetical protein
VDEAQEITGIYNSKALTVLAWALADENAVVMAFFDSFGVSLGEVSFTRGGAVLTSQIFPPSLKAEYIIADFQLCFYRGGALSRALAKGGLVLKEARKLDADGNLVETRAVFDKRKPGGALPLIEIEKRQGRVRYVNHKRGYAFSIAPQ